MLNKNPKRKIAKRLLSKEETENGVHPFDSKNWSDRKASIAARVDRRTTLNRQRREVKQKLK